MPGKGKHKIVYTGNKKKCIINVKAEYNFHNYCSEVDGSVLNGGIMKSPTLELFLAKTYLAKVLY